MFTASFHRATNTTAGGMTSLTSTEMPVVSLYHTITTVPQVFDLVGDEVCARWETLGTMDSKVHWQYGAEAESLIAENVPALLVYKAIAIKAGKNSQTIRKAYYTYKAFTAEQRNKYNLAPYSVFKHAATCKDKEKVLQHYIDNRSSVDEIETVFPATPENEAMDTEFRKLDLPRMFYGIYREIWGIDPAKKKKVITYLAVIKRIIDEVNK